MLKFRTEVTLQSFGSTSIYQQGKPGPEMLHRLASEIHNNASLRNQNLSNTTIYSYLIIYPGLELVDVIRELIYLGNQVLCTLHGRQEFTVLLADHIAHLPL